METSFWVTLFSAGGGGSAIALLIKGFFDIKAGKHDREKTKSSTIVDQLTVAWDREAALRERLTKSENLTRQALDQLSIVRRIAIEHGVDEGLLPKPPNNS